LLTEPKVGFLQKLVYAVFRKEFGRDSAESTFVLNRFRAIFAKLGEVAMIIRTWPSTALAIKAMKLIDLEQGRSAAR